MAGKEMNGRQARGGARADTFLSLISRPPQIGSVHRPCGAAIAQISYPAAFSPSLSVARPTVAPRHPLGRRRGGTEIKKSVRNKGSHLSMPSLPPCRNDGQPPPALLPTSSRGWERGGWWCTW